MESMPVNIQEGIIITSLSGTIEYINAKVVEILKFEEVQLLGQPITDLIYDRRYKDEWDQIVAGISKGKPLEEGTVKMVSKNGRLTPVKMSCSTMKKPSHGESWLVFYIVDISREIDTSKELEKRNRELTRENSKLMKESSNFKRISELKTKFLGIASHELKTPLTSIKGYSEILLDTMVDELSPKVKRMVERISRAGDKLHNVVNDMLDVSRIEQNRLRLKPEDLDLKELLIDCRDEVQHFLEKRNIESVFNVPDGLPTYYGDKVRMHQVFTNLFSNAVKYSPDNTTITCNVEIRDGGFHIIIKDQGVGIDPIEHENIFTPFYEVANTVNHSTGVKFMGGGTGLGLSIVKGIIQRHGGEIWVESDGPDATSGACGSEFHIQLPLESNIHWSDDETQIMKLNSIMEQPIKSSKFKQSVSKSDKRRILIIDDDAETVEICRFIFEENFELLTSATGEVGLRIAFRDKPDLIMLNFYLPGLGGTQICRILKTQEETKGIPVAFFSAATQDNEIEQCYASGGDDFIVKPFSNRELMDKVKNLISGDDNIFKIG